MSHPSLVRALAIIVIWTSMLVMGACEQSNGSLSDGSQHETSSINTNSESITSVESDPSGELIGLDEEIEMLVKEAFRREWRVLYGDINFKLEDQFEADGIPYVFYNEDIDTIDEMTSYLNEVFTDPLTERITRNIFPNMKDGRLYRTDGEIGTLMNWKAATPTLVHMAEDAMTVTYEFKVPTTDDEHSLERVELVQTDEGWRVNTFLNY